MATINGNPVQNLVVSKGQAITDAKSSKSVKKSSRGTDEAKQLPEPVKTDEQDQTGVRNPEDMVTIQNLQKRLMGEQSDLEAQDISGAQKRVEEIKDMIRAGSDMFRPELAHDLKHENVAGLLA